MAGAKQLFAAGTAAAQWPAVFGAIAAMVGVLVLVVRSCSPGLPPIGATTGVETLPPPIRSAASCHQVGAVQQCVIAAADPLLYGGIVGGSDLPLSVQIEAPDKLADQVSRWRAAGPVVVADGSAFVAIGPSATVWFADTRNGMCLETGTFTNSSGARTFVLRSGLMR